MMVFLIRHGPAVPSGTKGVADEDRRLTPDGRKKTERAFEGLRTLRPGIDEIHASPFPRALETAEILATVFKIKRLKETELLRPGAPTGSVLELLKDVKGKAPALVGHEPGMSVALGLLLGAGGGTALPFKKAGVAAVELEPSGTAPRGLLRLFLSPAVLRELA
jgi:phosphohistidine phosphatase